MHELINTRTGEVYTFPSDIHELTPPQYLYYMDVVLRNMAGELTSPEAIKQQLFVYFTGLKVSARMAFATSETSEAVWDDITRKINLLDSFFDIATVGDKTTYALHMRCVDNLLPVWENYNGSTDFLNGLTWGQFKNCLNALRMLNDANAADDEKEVAFFGSEIFRTLYKLKGEPAERIPDTVQFHAINWFGYWYELITTTPININGEDIDFYTLWEKDDNEDEDDLKDKSGWMGVTFSIAETGVFGDSTQVDAQPLLNVLMYLYRQRINAKIEEKKNKNTPTP